jgi:hypothetical protein
VPVRRHAAVAALLLSLSVTACDDRTEDMTATPGSASRTTTDRLPTRDALRSLAGKRVYFAHQSVGRNILSGLEQVSGADSLKVVKTREPATVQGPALVHFDAGRNEHPETKNVDFLAVLDARAGRDSGIAMMKYCFLDMALDTDVQQLFANYRRTVEQVRTKHPDVTVVHVTMPLTTDATGPKAAIKRLLGRPTARDANLKRNEYNALLRAQFANEPVFDIAALESTRPDGTRQQATLRGQTVYSLVPEYTDDGGHLKPEPSARFAEELVRFLGALRPAAP